MSDYTEARDVAPDASAEVLEAMLFEALDAARFVARSARIWLHRREYPYVRREVTDVIGYSQRALVLFERLVALLAAERKPSEEVPDA